jgi:histidinol-phosphate aminotransferase
MMKTESFIPEQLIRPDIVSFPPYSMGHLRLSELDHVIKLDLNENSLGPSPKAIAALAEMQHYHRYVGQDELRTEIAAYVGVDKSHIVVSNGADEMIDLIERIFLNHGDAILECPPSFEMYSFFARLNGARIVQIPRREDFSLNIGAIETAISDCISQDENSKSSADKRPAISTPKLIFIASPSNPDGSVATREEVERLLQLPAMIVLDEAYAEFAGESLASLVPVLSNLIVLRTFSKWAGLASLRIGYCIAPRFVTERLLQCKSPENVNSAGIVAARASLQDKEYLLGNVRRIVSERDRLAVALAQLKFLEPLPSRANFILSRVHGRDGKQIQGALAERGILIRSFNSPRLKDYIRIAVGTPEQNKVLLNSLEEIGRE